jgi:Protein phosphatase 2A regulatory B subunit (B56 family)/Protein kinase domain
MCASLPQRSTLAFNCLASAARCCVLVPTTLHKHKGSETACFKSTVLIYLLSSPFFFFVFLLFSSLYLCRFPSLLLTSSLSAMSSTTASDTEMSVSPCIDDDSPMIQNNLSQAPSDDDLEHYETVSRLHQFQADLKQSVLPGVSKATEAALVRLARAAGHKTINDFEPLHLFSDHDFYRQSVELLPIMWHTHATLPLSERGFTQLAANAISLQSPIVASSTASVKTSTQPLNHPQLAKVVTDEDRQEAFRRINMMCGAYTYVTEMLKLDCLDEGIAPQHFGHGFVSSLISRLRAPLTPKEEAPWIRNMIHAIYARFVPLRAGICAMFARSLSEYRVHQKMVTGISELLQVYAAIVRGFRTPLAAHHTNFLDNVIMPLHDPHESINELTPALQPFHQALTYVLVGFLEKDASLVQTMVPRIMRACPSTLNSNTKKEVLLLHAIEKIVEFSDVHTFSVFARRLSEYLAKCSSSLHARLAEKALMMWKNDAFVSRVVQDPSNRAVFFPCLFRSLLAKPSWNKTVNRMRGNVLRLLHQRDTELFAKLSDKYWGTSNSEGTARTIEFIDQYLQVREAPDAVQPDVDEFEDETLLDHIQDSEMSIDSADVTQSDTKEDSASATTPMVDADVKSVHRPEYMTGVPKRLGRVTYFDFVFGHTLGDGSFACVRYAKKIKRGLSVSKWKEYAIKVIDRDLIVKQKYEENIKAEIRIMTQLAHPNIARLLAVCNSENHIYLVLEFAKKGDLFSHIHKLGSLDVPSARFVLAEVLAGLAFMHRCGIVFGDLKPENVLIMHNGHAKVCVSYKKTLFALLSYFCFVCSSTELTPFLFRTFPLSHFLLMFFLSFISSHPHRAASLLHLAIIF